MCLELESAEPIDSVGLPIHIESTNSRDQWEDDLTIPALSLVRRHLVTKQHQRQRD